VNAKNLFPGICLLLLIISEVFLFSANHQKSVAQAQLKDALQQMADLQSQISDITNSLAYANGTEISRLRAENQDLPRLRKEIQGLLAENEKLSEQLGKTSDAAKEQEQQLEAMQQQNEQAAEDQQAQDEAVQKVMVAQRATCVANLRLIYAAKQAWALEKNKTDADTPSEQDLLPYLKGGVFPVCPSGGSYTIGAVGVLPTCSVSGHVLPPQ
jgi:chromosome segregation ATPase